MDAKSNHLDPRTEQAVPNVPDTSVIGVFNQLHDAEAACRALQNAGFPPRAISLVMKQIEEGASAASDQTMANEGAITGASIGAVLGGALGLVALTVPGLGPLLAAGPAAAALGGALTGGAVGGLAGSFAGLSLPTDKAHIYEEAVRAGRVLLSVRTPDEASERAAMILTEHGAQEVTSFER